MREKQGKKKVNEIQLFSVPFDLGEIKENLAIATNTLSNSSKEGLVNQAFKFHSLGNISEAVKYYQNFINQGFNDHRVFFNYAVILKNLGKLQDAELFYRKAIELYPNFAEAHSNLGNILKDLGKSQDAELFYLKAIELNPNFIEAYFNLFLLYEKTNNLKKLEESLKEYNNVDSIKNELFLFSARLSFRSNDYKTSKELIDNISPQWIENSYGNKNIIFWSYKGFIEDKVGNYDIAYSCFEKSQDDSSYLRFNRYSYLSLINSYKLSIVNKSKICTKYNDGVEDYNLAFLLGFPRSGTTLLDTILRSHKDIDVIEEKPLISTIEKLVQEKFNTKIENIFNISEENVIKLRQNYFELLRKYKTNNINLVIDKLPLNTVSLPLINLLFPQSKIIFTHRHPYDTVLSCFQQYFQANEAMANLISLKSSSIMYDQIMSAWDLYKNNLPLDFITSKYEHLIDDLDGHMLKVLDFLGLGWDQNVKNYRNTALERVNIHTPSSSQVIQPLYKSSIDKWKNYNKYFEDCHQYLEKWISYFDY